ncbi:hypothetical protein ABPG74_019589 [Tetrahymena malaccensis]
MQLQVILRNSNQFEIQSQTIYPNYSSFQNLTQPQQVDFESNNIELEESNNQNMEYQNNIFSGSNQMNQQNQYLYQNNNEQTMKIMFSENQNNDIFKRFNNNNQIKNNIFEPLCQNKQSNNQMEVIDNVNTGYQEDKQQDEAMMQQQNEERDLLRKCISDMMCKKQENCRSKKRYNILNLHRNRIIENTLDLIYYDAQYFTTEDFEYRVCMNIEKLVKEQEELDQMKYDSDLELQRVEEEYYRKQIEQFNQNYEQEIEEDENDDDSDEINIIQLNDTKFNQNKTQVQYQNNF